eukprot:3091269-Amphidinium_carterae.1
MQHAKPLRQQRDQATRLGSCRDSSAKANRACDLRRCPRLHHGRGIVPVSLILNITMEPNNTSDHSRHSAEKRSIPNLVRTRV